MYSSTNLKFIEIKKHKISYLDWGDKNNPETIICLHGVTQNSRYFDYLAYELSLSGFRVIAVDMIGRGSSDYLEDYTLYNYQTYQEIMIDFIEQLSLKNFSLIGTSMGGIISLLLANKVPKKIKAVIINDIGPYIESRSQQILYKYVTHYPEFNSTDECRNYLKFFLAPLNITEEKHWNHLVEHNYKKNKDKFLLNFDYNIILSIRKRTASNSNLWEIWHDIDKKIPMLILRGERSRILSTMTLEKMLQTRERINYFEYKNTGHTPSLMDINQIDDIKVWLLNTLHLS